MDSPQWKAFVTQQIILACVPGALAIIASAGRFYIRLVLLKRPAADDAIHALALATLVAYLALTAVTSICVWDLSEEFIHNASIAQRILFLTVEILVKCAFLALYRGVFGVSDSFRRAWWVVATFVFVAYWATFAALLWPCNPTIDPVTGYGTGCYWTPGAPMPIGSLILGCVLNVTTGLAIILLPLGALRGLQMRWSRKAGLVGVFTLALTDVLLDVLRTLAVWHSVMDTVGGLWSTLEPCIAVIVSALPVYGTLLGAAKRRTTTNASGHKVEGSWRLWRILPGGN